MSEYTAQPPFPLQMRDFVICLCLGFLPFLGKNDAVLLAFGFHLCWLVVCTQEACDVIVPKEWLLFV